MVIFLTKRNYMIFFILILNVFLINLSTSDENTPVLRNVAFNRNQKYSTVKCINNILTNHFPCGTLTTFVNPDTDVDNLIKNFSANMCHSVIVRSFEDRNWFIWTNVYVITANDLLGLRVGMMDLTRDVFWNPKAKFIVQLDNLWNNDEGIHVVFKILLKYRIYNVIFFKNIQDDAVIYTYHPFDNNNCGNNFDEIITLGTCENEGDTKEYFSYKVPDIMRNCTIKVVASDDVPNFISESSNYTVYGKFVPGLEQYVLDTIAVREGLVIDYHIFDEDETYGIVLPNGTVTGLLNYIDRDKADIAAGGYVLMKNRVELFDYVWGFNYAAYYLYTPAIGDHIWQRVYREFGLLTWLLVAAATALVLFVCIILKILFGDNTFSILNLWGYAFGNAGTGLSKNKRFRIIIFWWAWFTFFISSFYNTALFSLTSVHVREKPHSIGVENLKSLPYEPCISDNSRMFFQFAYNQSLPQGKAIHSCTYTDGSLKYVATNRRSYAIEMEYSYNLKEYQYISDTGKPKLDAWLFSSTNVIVMYLDRGFPFILKFQDYAHRLYEAGLIKNHLNTINLRSYSVLQRRPKTFTKTKLLDLRMHFAILFIGYILSFICFLLEIWYNNIKQERKSKRLSKVK